MKIMAARVINPVVCPIVPLKVRIMVAREPPPSTKPIIVAGWECLLSLHLVRANRTETCTSLDSQVIPPITTRPIKLAVSPKTVLVRITMTYTIVTSPSAIETLLFQRAVKKLPSMV